MSLTPLQGFRVALKAEWFRVDWERRRVSAHVRARMSAKLLGEQHRETLILRRYARLLDALKVECLARMAKEAESGWEADED